MKARASPGATPEVVDAVLAEAAKFAELHLAPLKSELDVQEADGGFALSPRSATALRMYGMSRWGAVSASPEYGGQGLPESVAFACSELIAASHPAFGRFTSHTRAVLRLIEHHASDELQQTYLPRLISAQWSATICLAESQAGFVDAFLTTSAAPVERGAFSIDGRKVVDGFGDHDLTENIVYLVSARLPDAARGPKGISLFLVPKYVLDESGSVCSQANGVVCTANDRLTSNQDEPGCVVKFAGARGYLLGRPHGASAGMFTLRAYAVADAHLARAERSLQGTAAYHQQRLQVRARGGGPTAVSEATPIVVHSDVRRMLLTGKVLLEGARALSLFAATQLDKKLHPAQAERRRADDVLAFLSRFLSGFLAEVCVEAEYWLLLALGTSYPQQSTALQPKRETRSTWIYEIPRQANDLLLRMTQSQRVAHVHGFLDEVAELVSELEGSSELRYQARALAELSTEWRTLSRDRARRTITCSEEAAGTAFDYHMYCGYGALAYLWARIAKAALATLGRVPDDELFLRTKLQGARFYFERILPRTRSLAAVLIANGP